MSDGTSSAAATTASGASTTTPASAPSATPSKLKATATEFVPGGASAGASKLSSTASSFKPNSSAKSFNPGAASFTPSSAQAPAFVPQQQQGYQRGNPYGGMQPNMAMGQQQFYPQMYPNAMPFGYPPQQFMPPYMPQGMSPMQLQQWISMNPIAHQQFLAAQLYAQQQQSQQMPPQQGNTPVLNAHANTAATPNANANNGASASTSQQPAAKNDNAPLLASPVTTQPQPTQTPAPIASTTSTNTASNTTTTDAKPAATPAATPAPAKPTMASLVANGPKPVEPKPAAAAPAATPATTDAKVSAAVPAADAKSTTTTTAPAASTTSAPAASAAAAFGVKPVAAWKPKSAAERERKPKQAEDEEAEITQARARANSSAETPAPAATAAAAPAAESKSATAATAAKPAAAVAPAAASSSRSQTSADAEKSLDNAIKHAKMPDRLQYGVEELLAWKDHSQLNKPGQDNLKDLNMTSEQIKLFESILKSSESAPAGGAPGDFGRGLRPGAGLRPGGGQQSSRISSRSTPVPVSGAPARAGFGVAAQPPRNPQAQRSGRDGGRDGGRGRNREQAPMDIGEIVPLAMTENRYRKLTDLPPNVELQRATTNILNKLTPEKFDVLVERVMELKITTAALLRDVVTCVFEKALAEPNYAPTYADFCVKLSARLPSFPADENDTQNTHNFKRLVLNQCQQEFETQDGVPDEHGKFAPGRISTEAFAALSEEEKAEHVAKLKRRTLGTIRFIGELYVRAMLAGKIMKSCIILLVGDINTPSEENIEALCKLLETVGKQMDQKTAKGSNHEFMNSVFGELEKLAMPPSKANPALTEDGRPALSSRIRFMIQDTLDLRRKDWVVRRKNEVDAKKISDVHKAAAAAAAQPLSAKPAPPLPTRLSARNKIDRYAAPAGSPTGKGGADDGWATVPTSTKRSQDVRGPMSVLSRGNSASASAASTPSNRTSVPTTPSKRQAEKNAAAAANKPLNAFGALGDHTDDEDDANGARGDDQRGEETEEGEQTGGEEEEAPAVDLSEEQIVDKSKAFMREYFSSEDFEEVKLCIKEIGGKAALSDTTVFEGLMLIIDGKDRDRTGFAKLLPLLFHNGYLTAEQIEGGFFRVLEVSEDFGPDFPRLIEYTANLLAIIVQEGVLPVEAVPRLSKPITAESDQVKFATFFLAQIKKLKEAAGADFPQFIREAGFKWADIAGESIKDQEKINKHLSDKKLELIVGLL